MLQFLIVFLAPWVIHPSLSISLNHLIWLYLYFLASHHSYDCVIDDDGTINDNHPAASTDYLALIQSNDAPNHELNLKKGAICSIMRNLLIEKWLVKNQHVVVINAKAHYIQIQTLHSRIQTNVTHCIPCINFDFKPPCLPYTIHRKQFPLQLAYSTTFNSCQGLTLDHVVIDYHEDVFTHGQLYTALTCICHQSDATLFIPNFKQDVTNVVYKSLLPTQQSNNSVLMTNCLFAPPPLHITFPSSSTILF